MSHTYASLADFKDWIVDNGSTDYGTTSDDALLLELEAASRRVDIWCNRSRFGSGFGPRSGTNRYDGDGDTRLWLYDDLLSITSITIYDATASASSGTATAETDYYLWPYDGTPYRQVILHGGSGAIKTSFTSGLRTVDIDGTWGYASETAAATATMGTATAAATSVNVSAAAEFSAGMTLLVDSEQLYVTSVSGTALSVDRGVNGTTAAAHADASSVAWYRYPREVKSATIRIAHRRWRSKEAGLTGDYGAGDINNLSNRDTEFAILRDTLARYRIFRAG